LDCADVAYDEGGVRLRSIQDKSISPRPSTGVGASFLVIVVRGKTPELASEIVETHWYRLSGEKSELEFEFGKFEEIHTVPGTKPKQYGGIPKLWEGWDRFEQVVEPKSPSLLEERTFIFGYGSLVSRENLERFLAKRKLQPLEVKEGSIAGFRRVWNVAMDNTKDIPGYKFYRDPETGERPDCVVTFLNIERYDASVVNGVAFEVPREAISHFDRRERNYERIDVTSAFSHRFKGRVRVWAYIAREDGLERYVNGVLNSKAVVDGRYVDEIERAFREQGEKAYQYYDASTERPTIQSRSLERNDIPEKAEIPPAPL
jgi:cation transport regulator ChaC